MPKHQLPGTTRLPARLALKPMARLPTTARISARAKLTPRVTMPRSVPPSLRSWSPKAARTASPSDRECVSGRPLSHVARVYFGYTTHLTEAERKKAMDSAFALLKAIRNGEAHPAAALVTATDAAAAPWEEIGAIPRRRWRSSRASCRPMPG